MRELQAILLVDDDKPTNFLHNRLLRKIGCEAHIQEAYSVADALSFLLGRDAHGDRPAEHDPQLILLDLNMPKTSGWVFLEDYAKHFGEDERTIVVLTTSLNPEDEQRALASDFVAEFRRKPMTAAAMAEILDTHFGFGGGLGPL